jgi:hypothetical protein
VRGLVVIVERAGLTSTSPSGEISRPRLPRPRSLEGALGDKAAREANCAPPRPAGFPFLAEGPALPAASFSHASAGPAAVSVPAPPNAHYGLRQWHCEAIAGGWMRVRLQRGSAGR